MIAVATDRWPPAENPIVPSRSGLMPHSAARLRMNAIWPIIMIHAAYNFMLILAFGHASPVTPTLPGFIIDTTVNLSLAVVGLMLLRGRSASARPVVREAA